MIAAMSELSAAVASAWREGVGPDELPTFRTLIATLDPADPAADAFGLFAAWLELLNNVRATVPTVTSTPALAVVHASALVMRARLDRDPVVCDAALAQLSGALSRLMPGDPLATARAWSDIALAELAVFVGDHASARRRFETASAVGNPVALRIHALLRLAAAAIDRTQISVARDLARKALAVADQSKRPQHAYRARMACALIDAINGDLKGMRTTIAPLLTIGDPFARALLAQTESAGNAMKLLAEGLRQATERSDPFAYMMCILVGARRYVNIGHDADALVTISAGIANLEEVAADLAEVLRRERTTWQETWVPGRYSQAEERAIAALDLRAVPPHP